MDMQRDSSVIIAVFAALAMAGVLYNLLIAWLERQGYLEGFTWLSVVIGVLITLGGVALIQPQAAALMLGAFTCSGAPMAAGAVWRYVRRRKMEQDDARQAAALAE